MTNADGRAALRGAEVEIFDLIAQLFTSTQWMELLKAPLEHALSQGNRGLAQKLVRAGAEAGEAPRSAVPRGHEDIVDHLLGCGASLAAAAGKSLLHHAVEEDNMEVVQLLLLRDVEKDAKDDTGCTPLYLAACRGHAAAAFALLAAGADANLTCELLNESVMHKAAEKGHADILRAAIEHGADTNVVDRYGGTPLLKAVESNEVKAIGVLVEAGADIDRRIAGYQSVVHVAAFNRVAEALIALSKHGADFNIQDIEGETPLHCALIETGEKTAEIVDVLLRSGADETIVNEDGLQAAKTVGSIFSGSEEDNERVRRLLANAPADRVWRRRGYLVLCRANPDRLRRGQEDSNVGAARRICREAGLARTDERIGENGTAGGTASKKGADAHWADVMASVLELQEDGIFRAIVEYL